MGGTETQDHNMDILDKIKTLPALESFNEKDLTELMRVSKIVRYEPGALIADEKMYERWLYYLISGRVRILKNGAEMALLQRTGDVFGAIGNIAASGDLSVSVRAQDVSTCLKIDIANVDGLPDENRYIFRYLIFRGFAEVLAKRLRITTEKYLKAKEEIERLKCARQHGR